jgi:DNA-binding CsgD family transcriptional regulator
VNGWIPIGEPEPQVLTPTEQRVKELLDAGYNYKLIAMIMRMSHDTTKDMIYEIRKKEGIMRKATITDEEKQTMKQMFAEGKTVQEIADATGRGRSSVDRIVNNRKPSQINPEFDAAVNEMIAEVKAEKAEEKSANAEPEKLPGVVCRAIDAGFHDLADEIDKRRNRIEELEAEIAEFEKDIDALRKWREAHP